MVPAEGVSILARKLTLPNMTQHSESPAQQASRVAAATIFRKRSSANGKQ
jgi:hypothetical protein